MSARKPAVQFLATEPHFDDHLRPVWQQIPQHARGIITAKPEELDPDTPTAVAAWGSYRQALQRIAHSTPVVFFEHGAGFTYNTPQPHPSYAGGPGRQRVDLFLNTNGFVDEKNRAAYPHTASAIVGSPKMDKLSAAPPPDPNAPIKTVAFSWHWECKVAPETRMAFPHYKHKLGTIAARNHDLWTPVGHAHPRAWRWVEPHYRRLRWPIQKDFNTIAATAHAYVCDTSSTIYEMAALDRPVIILNAPWYRRNVSHGLRFWDHLPGPTVDEPFHLADTIRRALTDDQHAEQRRTISELVYPHRGQAARRAADAIMERYG